MHLGEVQGPQKGLAGGSPTRLKGNHEGGNRWTESYAATVTMHHTWEFQMRPYL